MDRYNSRVKSPHRQAINKELDQHTNRIKELLQQDYIRLEQENIQLKMKCATVIELEDKVELVLKNNQELMFENEKLAKLLEQSHQDSDMLRNKLDSIKMANQGASQYERKKFLLQIDRLQKQISQIERLNNIAIKQIKSKHLIDIENLRRDHEVGLKLYDDQLIKLKDQINFKQAQVGQLQSKLNKFQAQSELKFHQLQEEKLKLKQEVKRLEPYPRLFENMKEDYEKLAANKKQQSEAHAAKVKQLYDKNKADVENLKNQARAQMEAHAAKLKQIHEKYRGDIEGLKNQARGQMQTSAAKMKDLMQKHRRQIEGLKNDLEDQKEEYTDKLRKEANNHKEEIDLLNMRTNQKVQQIADENNVLKERIRREQRKVSQQQEKIRQLLNDKQRLENTEQKLHNQIESQKQKIQQLLLLNSKQYEALKEKFQSIRQAELFQIQASHQQMRRIWFMEKEKLTQEIFYLSTDKSKEVNHLVSELNFIESQFRNRQIIHEKEMQKNQGKWMKILQDCELELGAKIKRNEDEYFIKIKKLEDDANAKFKKMESDSASLKLRLETQNMTLERQKRRLLEENNKKSTEIVAYKQIVENQKEQIKQSNKRYEQKQKTFQQKEEEWMSTNIDLKNRIQRIEQAYQSFQQQTKKTAEEKQKEYRQNLADKQKMIDRLQRENQSIKQFVGNRDKSILEVNRKISDLNRVIDEKNEIIDALRLQIIELSKKNANKIQSQKANLHEHYSSKIKFITQDYNSRILLLEAKIEDLNEQVKVKESELEELLRQYKKMREEMVVLSEQDANKKEMSLKFPGATADLIASKNMFDVLIKSKVLQTCHEVVRKSFEEGEVQER